MIRSTPLIALLALAALGAARPAAAETAPPGTTLPGAMPGDTILRVGPPEELGITFAARFLDDGTVIANYINRLMRIRLADGKALWQTALDDPRRGLAVAAGGRQVLVGSTSGAVEVYDVADGRLTAVLPGHPIGMISAVVISPDGRDIVAASYDGRLGWWRDRKRRPVPWSPAPTDGRDPAPPPAPMSRLEAAAFAPDGSLLLAGDGPDRVALIVLDPETLTPRRSHSGPADHAPGPSRWSYGMGLALSPDGRALALGYWGGGLELVQWPSLKTRWVDEASDNWVADVRWAPDGRRLWSVAARQLHVYRAADGHNARLRHTRPNHALDAFDRSERDGRLLIGPRATGALLIFTSPPITDWQPPRYAGAKRPMLAVPPPLAPDAHPCEGIRCPVGEECFEGGCRPRSP